MKFLIHFLIYIQILSFTLYHVFSPLCLTWPVFLICPDCPAFKFNFYHSVFLLVRVIPCFPQNAGPYSNWVIIFYLQIFLVVFWNVKNLLIYLKHVILSNGNISQVTETKMKTNVYVVNLLLLLLFFSFNFWRIRDFLKWRSIGSRLIIFVYHSLSILLDNILLNYINLTMNVEFLCDRCRYFVNINLFNLYNKTRGIGVITI